MKDVLKTGQVLGRSEMKKIMAGSGGGCGAGCVTGCRSAAGGTGCIEFYCEDGWCNSRWSNCCNV